MGKEEITSKPHTFLNLMASKLWEKMLVVLHGFQLFKYVRHFTELPKREEQERSVVLKGEKGMEGSLGQPSS